MTKSTPRSETCPFESHGIREDEVEDPFQAGFFSNTKKWTDTVSYGENIPGWRQKLREGLDATTSLSGTSISTQFTPGHVNLRLPKLGVPSRIYRRIASGLLYNQVSWATADPAGLSDSAADSKALGQFHQRIYEARTPFMGGVFIGELAETLRMIRNPAQGLRREVDVWLERARQLRRGRSLASLARSIRVKKITENLADAWLETQYGWKPLFHDIADGAQALYQLSRGQKYGLISIRGYGRKDLPSSESSILMSQLSVGGNIYYYLVDSVISSWTEVRYRGAMRAEARNPKLFDEKLLGFDTRSFLPTVWELIPYSFLIDYFTNVGDIIMGWSNLGVRLAWSNRSSRKVSKLEQRTRPHPTFNSGIIGLSASHSPAEHVVEARSVSRTKITGLPMPGFELELPGSWSLKWLNIAALVAARRNDRKWFYD